MPRASSTFPEQPPMERPSHQAQHAVFPTRRQPPASSCRSPGLPSSHLGCSQFLPGVSFVPCLRSAPSSPCLSSPPRPTPHSVLLTLAPLSYLSLNITKHLLPQTPQLTYSGPFILTPISSIKAGTTFVLKV